MECLKLLMFNRSEKKKDSEVRMKNYVEDILIPSIIKMSEKEDKK